MIDYRSARIHRISIEYKSTLQTKTIQFFTHSACFSQKVATLAHSIKLHLLEIFFANGCVTKTFQILTHSLDLFCRYGRNISVYSEKIPNWHKNANFFVNKARQISVMMLTKTPEKVQNTVKCPLFLAVVLYLLYLRMEKLDKS